MAKTSKSIAPVNGTIEIVAPHSIAPLCEAFHVPTDEAAKSLIAEAGKMIFKDGVTDEELEVIVSLMRSIAPRDGIETLLAANLVSCHMLGTRKLSSRYEGDQRLGLKLLRFSSEVAGQLEKKRRGINQSYNVNYNYNVNKNLNQDINHDKTE